MIKKRKENYREIRACDFTYSQEKRINFSWKPFELPRNAQTCQVVLLASFIIRAFEKIFHLKWKKNKVIFSEKKNFAIKEITCEAEENLVRQKLQNIEAEAF